MIFNCFCNIIYIYIYLFFACITNNNEISYSYIDQMDALLRGDDRIPTAYMPRGEGSMVSTGLYDMLSYSRDTPS